MLKMITPLGLICPLRLLKLKKSINDVPEELKYKKEDFLKYSLAEKLIWEYRAGTFRLLLIHVFSQHAYNFNIIKNKHI